MKDKLIELIQNSVGGCARHWAEIIASHLIANNAIILPEGSIVLTRAEIEALNEHNEKVKREFASEIFAEIEFEIAQLDFDREETRAIHRCPYEGLRNCIEYLCDDAVSLVKELTAKTEAQDITISELRKSLEKAKHDADRYARKIKELAEENERLKSQRYMIYADGRVEALGHNDPTGEPGKCGLYEQCRANTVREMQAEIINRCIQGGIYPAFVATTIDKIAKEMIENG